MEKKQYTRPKEQIFLQQARKPRSYASSKLWLTIITDRGSLAKSPKSESTQKNSQKLEYIFLSQEVYVRCGSVMEK